MRCVWVAFLGLCLVAGAATPAATDQGSEEASAPAGSASKEPNRPDVDGLLAEYAALRERLFTSRARARAVSDALYSAKLRVHLVYRSTRFHTVRRAVLRLDGVDVFEGSGDALAADAPRIERFVAPGPHTLTILLEVEAQEDSRFTRKSEDTLAIDVPDRRLLVVRARAADDGDIAWSFSRKNRGSYRPRLEVELEAENLMTPKGAHGRR